MIIITDHTNFTSQRQVRVVTRDRIHIKPTQITAEQYLQEQLQKHTTTDSLEDILKQLDKQPSASNTHTINKGPCTN